MNDELKNETRTDGNEVTAVNSSFIIHHSSLSVLVLGMNLTGTACVRFLQGKVARLVWGDTRPQAKVGPAAAEETLIAERLFELTDFASAGDIDLVVTSPGLPLDLPLFEQARQRGAETIGEIELASRVLDTPLLVVTGTNGKGTTVTLTGAMLQQAGLRCRVVGNIGDPLINHVDAARDLDFLVVEASSFQLESTVTFRPFVGALLNAAPDHLEHHRTFDNYLAAKARLFAHQRPEDHAVLGVDDPAVKGLVGRVGAQVHTFATGTAATGAWLDGEMLCLEGVGPLLPVREIGLRGPHNVRNAMAAALIARLAGAPPEAIVRALRAARPLEHVQELVAEIGGVRYINDTKATNPAAALAALDAVEGPVIVIAGGSEKNADFTGLGQQLAERVKLLLVIGDCGPRLAEVTRAAGGESIEAYESLQAAVSRAAEVAEPGDTVLLAPACASFGLFENYAHRGRVFRELVRGLEKR